MKFQFNIPDEEISKKFADMFSFNIRNDLKGLNITTERLLNEIKDKGIDNNTIQKGATLLGNKFKSIRKIDLNLNNTGSKKGIRLIVLVICKESIQNATLIHAYNKSKKKKLSKKENDYLSKLYDQF